MNTKTTWLLSSGEFCKLRYDTIPVKSASANVSFYTSNSKIPSFELWHSFKKWALCSQHQAEYLTLNKKTIKLTYLLTYLLTYTMVQSPSWEANWFATSQEFPRISPNPKVHYRTHNRLPPVSILGQPNLVHIPTSHLLEIHPNIIHPSTPRSPQWSPSLRFPHQDPINSPIKHNTIWYYIIFLFKDLYSAWGWLHLYSRNTYLLFTRFIKVVY